MFCFLAINPLTWMLDVERNKNSHISIFIWTSNFNTNFHSKTCILVCHVFALQSGAWSNFRWFYLKAALSERNGAKKTITQIPIDIYLFLSNNSHNPLISGSKVTVKQYERRRKEALLRIILRLIWKFITSWNLKSMGETEGRACFFLNV